jgi:predicted deacylase
MSASHSISFFIKMKKVHNEYTSENIEKIKRSASPRVLLNVCAHGDEKVGLRVAEFFQKHNQIKKGTLIINIANKEAVKANKRFLEKDLNRVFPGKIDGTHEERLAHEMAPFIQAFDLVIDVHSTNTGVSSTLILEKYNKKILEIVSAVKPRRALVMRATKSNALISMAKMGIAFEYGRDTDKNTYEGTKKGIERIFHHLGMITLKQRPSRRANIDFYDVFEGVPKPLGFIVSSKIKNFQLIKKGQVIGENPESKKVTLASKDFYPILFGKNTYKEIFGFAAKKIKYKK